MLPISVLVPTRNSMSLLPKHIESMRAWIDLAEEVVAVDSESDDGTLEYLERELKHANARVLKHPRGLYQSWNFGIAQCRANYIYISTVGETITRQGIESLFAAAEQFKADVVISPPRMVKMSGEEKKKVWPIHTLIDELRLRAPVALDGPSTELFAISNLLRGVLGSSASNLYRAAILQAHPFRTDFGTAGDLAWGLEHAAQIRLGIVPQCFSTFLFHPKAYAKSDYAVEAFSEKCLHLAQAAVRATPIRDEKPGSNSARALAIEILSAWERFLSDKRAFTLLRRNSFWWLSPAAWRAYQRRSRSFGELQRVQQRASALLPQRVLS